MLQWKPDYVNIFPTERLIIRTIIFNDMYKWNQSKKKIFNQRNFIRDPQLYQSPTPS